ncbi:MAG: A/G-specific adenine glycosylase [Propioniciclava sp.]|uniref:A/G-specific adenine glycosylase n=1 Tax=Propioniciclava sp. TaxID=2038686 RepID=UPI0039E61977
MPPTSLAAPAHGVPLDRPAIVDSVLGWYATHARPLPWREPQAGPWGVMVSEFMLQQTPVARVLPAWTAWMERWPSPAALAAEPVGEAVRAWGRLGYPRRAQRLHASATVIRDEYDGRVPDDVEALRALPGVGEYTAAAIAAFGHGRRTLVLDTNVRRVLARIETGRAFAPDHLARAERERGQAWVPRAPDAAAAWAAASMELGALVCTAERPRCTDCPVRPHCAWFAAGRPAWDGAPRKGQTYAGTDRQCRGVLLAGLRETEAAVPAAALLARWPSDPAQARRALDSLLADGLVRTDAAGNLRL